MKKFDMYEYPKIIRDAWTVQNALRRLGFLAESIYFTLVDHASSCSEVWIYMEAQGKDFKVRIGPCAPHAPDEIERLWTEFGERYNNREYDKDQAQQVYEEGPLASGGVVQFVTALITKGFVLPFTQN